jgi:glyoxylase-like metal-dependent hydrolase (beta-lactamase superfamily II)
MNWLRSRCVCGAVFCGAALMMSVLERARAASPVIAGLVTCLPANDCAGSKSETLHLDVFIGAADSWDVTSTLIYGKSEAILVDCQFRISQAKKLADQVAARGRRLKAIIITHPDNDHYIGTAVLRERFPDTPIYMTAAALEEFRRTSGAALAAMKASAPSETPDSLPTPDVLPATILTVDGETVEVIKDLQGDVLKPTNSFLWIPSLHAVVAGDIVFNGVYPYFGDSSVASRRAWHDSLQLIATLHPRVVTAGHKKNANLPDSPGVVAAMEKYLNDFESARKAASGADELVAAMKAKYRDWSQERLLVYSAKAAMAEAAQK